MLNLTLKELRLIAKNRNMGGYKSIRKDKLLRLFTYQKHQTIFLLIYLTLKLINLDEIPNKHITFLSIQHH